jgi:hypothetical protein
MSNTTKLDDEGGPVRPRLKKETLRGLGFTELDAVRGGNHNAQVHEKPVATRNCLEPR